MMAPRQIPLASIGKFAALYLVLVGYSAAYEYFFAAQLTPLFHDEFTAYDLGKSGVYSLICLLTPLAILPIGTRLRAPGQFIAGALAIFIFIPIPIVFVPMVGIAEYWRIYALLWVGYFSVCALSSIAVGIRLPNVSESAFRGIILAIYALFAAGLLYSLAVNHVALVSLGEAHAAQADVTVSGLQGYLLVAYITSFGGLLVAMTIMYRKYHLLLLAAAGFLVCYVTLSERNAALMPAWIAFIYLAHRLYFRDSTIKYFVALAAPFLLGTVLAAILGTADRHSLFYDAFTLANYRLFSVPAIGFNVYYNFFQINPLTYWSHINVVSKFISNPYEQPLALVLAAHYQLGNYNASFLETDGLAAAGPAMLPFISMIFGCILMAINSCSRGLNITLCAIVTAGSSVALMDTGIGPGLITNGLALLALVLLLAPRDAPWNLRYLKHCAR